jgi:DNA/RNA endonuclease G (NUC1)
MKKLTLYAMILLVSMISISNTLSATEKDSIHIWTGNLGESKKVGKVSVPETCWKVIYIKKDKQFKAYLFKNDTSKPDGIGNNEVPIETITKLTGFKFK